MPTSWSDCSPSAPANPSAGMRADAMSSTLSVHDLTEHDAGAVHTVLEWIRSGELKAVNVSRRPGSKKPRWRITPAALDAFEALRTPTPPPPKTRRRNRPADVIEFYK